MKACIVVVDQIDAARIDEVAIARDECDIVSLSPAAHAELRKRGHNAIRSDEIYTNEIHEKIVLGWTQREETLRRISDELDLTDAESQVFRWFSHNAVNCGLAIQEILAPWNQTGALIDDRWAVADSDVALEMICASLFGETNKVAIRKTGAVESAKRSIYFFVAGFLRPKILTCGRARGLGALVDEIRAFKPDTRVAYLAGGLRYNLSIKDILQVFVLPFRKAAYPIHCPFFLDKSEHSALTEKIKTLSGRGAFGVGMRAAAPSLASSILECRTWMRQLDRMPNLRRAHSTIAWDSKVPKNAALVYFGIANSGKSAIICHASVAPGTPRARDDAKKFANRIMAAPGPEVLGLVQSPLSDRAVADMQPRAERIAVPPFLWRTDKQTRDGNEMPEPGQAKRLSFLWAGNFQDWHVHQPFHQETSHEMFEGLRQLCEAFSAFPSLELEISVKPHWRVSNPCHPALIEELARGYPNVSVANGKSFEKSLLKSCCVVSFSSTVIEQSLHARKPVLLWGAKGRSPYIPADILACDDPEERVVFAALSRTELREAINRIVALVERPIPSSYFDRFVWGQDCNADAAVRRLVGE